MLIFYKTPTRIDANFLIYVFLTVISLIQVMNNPYVKIEVSCVCVREHGCAVGSARSRVDLTRDMSNKLSSPYEDDDVLVDDLQFSV
jgi:hypothetical protein